MWAGVDVGGRRKGFHVAVVDETRVVEGPVRLLGTADVLERLRRYPDVLVAVDSPCSPAAPGLRSRPAERELAGAVCGNRYTPDEALLAGSSHYEWIVVGLELYAALERARVRAIECFPTASWTRWVGAKGARTRAAWSREGLRRLVLADVPPGVGQDGRDAIAAALTARAHECGATESFGEIVVPVSGAPRA